MNYLYEIFLFIAGFLWEILATIDIQAVQRGEALKSALATFILTFLGYTIFYNIIKSPDVYLHIIIFALGCAVGAYVTIKYNKCKV